MEQKDFFLFKEETQLRVRYGETDQMGYCYYGNYAQYFEVGRVETMRSLGMSYKYLENKGIMLPVASYNVKYISPCFYDDLLTIITKIVALKGVKLYFEYEIRNEKEELLSVAETVLIFVDKETRKPTRPPHYFLQLLNL